MVEQFLTVTTVLPQPRMLEILKYEFNFKIDLHVFTGSFQFLYNLSQTQGNVEVVVWIS